MLSNYYYIKSRDRSRRGNTVRYLGNHNFVEGEEEGQGEGEGAW